MNASVFHYETIILSTNYSGKLRLCRNERNKIEIAPPSKKSAKKGSGKSPVTRTRSARSPSARGRLTRTLSGSVIVNQSVTGFVIFSSIFPLYEYSSTSRQAIFRSSRANIINVDLNPSQYLYIIYFLTLFISLHWVKVKLQLQQYIDIS